MSYLGLIFICVLAFLARGIIFAGKSSYFQSFVYHKIDEKSFPMRIFVSKSHNLIIRFSSKCD
jgi:hypothetical protein